MKKILPLAVLVSNIACGDTNNSYYTNGGVGAENHVATCDDYASKLLQCNITDQSATHQGIVKECINVGMEEKHRQWLNCVYATPCSELQQGACAEYLPDY